MLIERIRRVCELARLHVAELPVITHSVPGNTSVKKENFTFIKNDVIKTFSIGPKARFYVMFIFEIKWKFHATCKKNHLRATLTK